MADAATSGCGTLARMGFLERRAAARSTHTGQALVARGATAFLVETVDLSSGGACVRRPRSWSFNIGDAVMLYHLGGVGPAMMREARVVWFRDDEIGLQYL